MNSEDSQIGYQKILKSVLKSEIQFLLQRLADNGEEWLVLTADVVAGTSSKFGSDKSDVFLDGQHVDDVLSLFLLHCAELEKLSQPVESSPVMCKEEVLQDSDDFVVGVNEAREMTCSEQHQNSGIKGQRNFRQDTSNSRSQLGFQSQNTSHMQRTGRIEKETENCVKSGANTNGQETVSVQVRDNSVDAVSHGLSPWNHSAPGVDPNSSSEKGLIVLDFSKEEEEHTRKSLPSGFPQPETDQLGIFYADTEHDGGVRINEAEQFIGQSKCTEPMESLDVTPTSQSISNLASQTVRSQNLLPSINESFFHQVLTNYSAFTNQFNPEGFTERINLPHTFSSVTAEINKHTCTSVTSVKEQTGSSSRADNFEKRSCTKGGNKPHSKGSLPNSIPGEVLAIKQEPEENTNVTECDNIDSKFYECEFCSSNFKTKYGLKLHIQNIHAPSNSYPFNCVSCNLGFQSSLSLKNHMVCHVTVQRSVKPYKCDFCSQSFVNRQKQDRHKFLKHSIQPAGVNINVFVCSSCGKQCGDKRTLSDHIRGVHRRMLAYRCKKCNKGFRWRSSLRSHLQRTCSAMFA